MFPNSTPSPEERPANVKAYLVVVDVDTDTYTLEPFASIEEARIEKCERGFMRKNPTGRTTAYFTSGTDLKKVDEHVKSFYPDATRP